MAVEGFVGAIGRRGIRPGQTAPGPMDDAAQYLSVIDPLYTPFLGEQGRRRATSPPTRTSSTSAAMVWSRSWAAALLSFLAPTGLWP